MTTAREILAEGERWTDRATRPMLPILIERALQGRRITYGDMKELLFRKHGISKARTTTYGQPAGKIGRMLIELSNEWKSPVPPLNTILVRADTDLPGDGADYFMRRYVNKPPGYRLTDDEWDALAEATIQDVFNYPRLKELADYFGAPQDTDSKPENTPIPRPPREDYGRGGESDEHKALKAWVATNPHVFDRYGKYGNGREEGYLDSGDEVDVIFRSKRSWLGVEVKTADAPEGELWRGVFQCIKYRAVLRAMAMADAEIPNVQVVLVVEEPPSARIKAIAKRVSVEWMDVGPLRDR